MVVPLDSVQVDYDPPTEYPDNEQDKPIDGLALVPHKPGFSSVLAVLTHSLLGARSIVMEKRNYRVA